MNVQNFLFENVMKIFSRKSISFLLISGTTEKPIIKSDLWYTSQQYFKMHFTTSLSGMKE